MFVPINLIITTLLFGLIIFLAYIFLNKLAKNSSNYIPQEDIPNPGNNIENNNNNNQHGNHNQNNRNNFRNQEPENIENVEGFKKLTKKEQAKMLKKQEKAQERENIRLLLAEKKKREQQKEAELLLKQKEKEAKEAEFQQQVKNIEEEEKRKKQEEYDTWKDFFKVGEEGEDRMDLNDIVIMLNQYEREGRIMGIIDDRGKYIYITEKEMGLIEKMLMNRGRISKTDLIKECNRLIRFEPTEQDKIKIAEEQEKTLKELEDELKVKK